MKILCDLRGLCGEIIMSKDTNSESMRDEYDFSSGVRGNYSQRFYEKTTFLAEPQEFSKAIFVLSLLLFLGWTGFAIFLCVVVMKLSKAFGGGSESDLIGTFMAHVFLWGPSVYFAIATLSTMGYFSKRILLILGTIIQITILVILLSLFPKAKDVAALLLFLFLFLAWVIHSLIWWKYMLKRKTVDGG